MNFISQCKQGLNNELHCSTDYASQKHHTSSVSPTNQPVYNLMLNCLQRYTENCFTNVASSKLKTSIPTANSVHEFLNVDTGYYTADGSSPNDDMGATTPEFASKYNHSPINCHSVNVDANIDDQVEEMELTILIQSLNRLLQNSSTSKAAKDAIVKLIMKHQLRSCSITREATLDYSEKLKSTKCRYKTELCKNIKDGVCEFLDRCHFAHSYDELRPRSIDPRYKTVPCKSFHSQEGMCYYSRRCDYIHSETEDELQMLKEYRKNYIKYFTFFKHMANPPSYTDLTGIVSQFNNE